MNIEEIREYAKENGLSEKRIEALINELHPDEKGELNTMEAMEAMAAINFALRTKENVRTIVEAVRADRNRNKTEG